MLAAAALSLLAAVEAARAGVHAGHQHEAGLVLRLAADAGHRYHTIFERLAQGFEGIAAELRQLVQEQHAVVGQADLAGACVGASADEAGHRRAVVGHTEGPGGHQPRTGRQLPGDGVDARGLQGLLEGQRGQNSRQAPGQHGLAGARYADHEHVVPSGRSDLQRAPCAQLALHLAEIHRAVARLQDFLIGSLGLGRNGFPALEVLHHLPQAPRRIHADALDAGHLLSVARGQDDLLNPLLAGADDHGQRAPHRLQAAVQGQFAQHQRARQLPVVQLARGHQDAHRHRQVKGRAFLLHVGGRKVHRQPCHRHGKAAVDNRCAHPVTAFLHRRIRQADNLQRRQPVGRINLHLHRKAADTAQPISQRSCQHRGTSRHSHLHA